MSRASGTASGSVFGRLCVLCKNLGVAHRAQESYQESLRSHMRYIALRSGYVWDQLIQSCVLCSGYVSGVDDTPLNQVCARIAR